MYNNNFHLWSVALFLMIFFCGCSDTEKTEQFQNDYNLTGVTSLKIVNINGNVSISNDVTPDTLIHVYALKRTFSLINDDLSNVTINVTGGVNMKIESIYKTTANVFVDYTIKLPANVSIDIDDTTGNINVDGVSNVGTIRTTTGDIKIKNVTYITNIISTTGYLDVNINDIKNDISLSTTNGGIKVYFKPNLNANLKTSKLSGVINNNGVALSGSYNINISVYNGNINLYYQ